MSATRRTVLGWLAALPFVRGLLPSAPPLPPSRPPAMPTEYPVVPRDLQEAVYARADTLGQDEMIGYAIEATQQDKPVRAMLTLAGSPLDGDTVERNGRKWVWWCGAWRHA